MVNMDFDWQIDEFMIYCRSKQLRERTMLSYEQALRLFQRWCAEQLNITEVNKVTESVIRRYISDLQERGKYTFYAVEKQKETNHPDRRAFRSFALRADAAGRRYDTSRRNSADG